MLQRLLNLRAGRGAGIHDRTEPARSPAGLPRLDTDRCTACGACATSCPTAAISLTPSERWRRTWRVDDAACVCCGRCQAACEPGAISLIAVDDQAALAREDLVVAVSVREPPEQRPPVPGESYWRSRPL